MDQKAHALVTTIGADRPGIVQAIAAWILEHGGNIEESRMAQLGGDFATIILVSGSHGVAAQLDGSRHELEKRFGLTVLTRPVSGTAPAPAIPVLRYRLQATSLDTAGIVHRVTGVLSAHGINIVSAESETTAAPFSGTPVFQFNLEIDIPSAVGIGRLREELRRVGDEQNIDFALEAM